MCISKCRHCCCMPFAVCEHGHGLVVVVFEAHCFFFLRLTGTLPCLAACMHAGSMSEVDDVCEARPASMSLQATSLYSRQPNPHRWSRSSVLILRTEVGPQCSAPS